SLHTASTRGTPDKAKEHGQVRPEYLVVPLLGGQRGFWGAQPSGTTRTSRAGRRISANRRLERSDRARRMRRIVRRHPTQVSRLRSRGVAAGRRGTSPLGPSATGAKVGLAASRSGGVPPASTISRRHQGVRL